MEAELASVSDLVSLGGGGVVCRHVMALVFATPM